MTTASAAPEPVFVDTNIPIYDSNIVATMIAQGIRKILTHNVGDFQRFSTWIEILPLVPSP